MNISGELTGLQPIQRKQLLKLYTRRYPTTVACSLEQARELISLSYTIRKQIAILIDRRGKVVEVIVGTRNKITLPELEHYSSERKQLRNLRVLHTHCNEELLTNEDVMDLLFLRLSSFTVLTMTKSGIAEKIQYAYLHSLAENPPYTISDALPIDAINSTHFQELQEIEEGFQSSATTYTAKEARAILVSIDSASKELQEQHLEELQQIAHTAGVITVATMIQKSMHKKRVISLAKIAELEILALQNNASMIIFDGELSPTELDTITKRIERPVIDRTQLILDIFAKHAHSKEGKLQVELAQLRYMQPRLAGTSSALDRLAGGIGGRGPGETKLELDRRKIAQTIHTIQQNIIQIQKRRLQQQEKRLESTLPIISLVGYTNAGKSSILNYLTKSTVLTENKLFATLESTTRKLYLSAQQEVLLTDTVGFIRNLPNELYTAFMSTLEELEVASILLHVADASHKYVADQIHSVQKILMQLGLEEIPTILILNKSELLSPEIKEELRFTYPKALFFSTREQIGKHELLQYIQTSLDKESPIIS